MLHFQPLIWTPAPVERQNFKSLSDRAEPGEYFKHLKKKNESGARGALAEKPKMSLFDDEKKYILELFSKFFLVISRFSAMLFNLVPVKTKTPGLIKISKKALRTLVIMQLAYL